MTAPAVEAALERMHADGYNVVRVFVSQNTIGTADDGLSQPYMQNVADFLARAKQNQIYVMITQDWLPGGRYGRLISQGCCDQFNFNNAQNLPPSAVEAYQVVLRGLHHGPSQSARLPRMPSSAMSCAMNTSSTPTIRRSRWIQAR